MTFICPSCQNPAVDGQSICIACGFSLAESDRRLGIPPQLTAPVADLHQHLSATEARRISALTGVIEKKFPQVHLAVVVDHVPADVSLSVYTFWLFNRAGISSSVERGADNHLVMLLLDAGANLKGASCMIGYGLEPFVPNQQLDSCLAATTPPLTTKKFGKAALAFLSALEAVLQDCCLRANRDEMLKDTPSAAPSELVPSETIND